MYIYIYMHEHILARGMDRPQLPVGEVQPARVLRVPTPARQGTVLEEEEDAPQGRAVSYSQRRTVVDAQADSGGVVEKQGRREHSRQAVLFPYRAR